MNIVITLIVFVYTLFKSYFETSPALSSDDFVKTPEILRTYMLISAILAFIFNVIHVFMMAYRGVSNLSVNLAIASYYFLQLLFIPFVRSNNRMLVRILLFVCCLPIFYLWMISKGNEFLLSSYVLFHVVINDFVLYGFLH